MKIKIPPYPNFKIKDQNLQQSRVPTQKKKNSKGLSSKLVMIVPDNDGEHRVLRTRSVSHEGRFYISALPNPVHLFLSSAIEYFGYSETKKQNNFPKCGTLKGEDVYLLPFEKDGTHECYNDYIKFRTTSIIMLVSSLEAFMNHIIPNDFVYVTPKKNYSKIEIESNRVIFKDKLEKVIPQYLQQPDLWENHPHIKSSIESLYETRKNLIHLKTNAEDEFEAYFSTIDEMFDLDIKNCIDSLISFMNIVKPDFVELG